MITLKITGNKNSLESIHTSILDSALVDICFCDEGILYPTAEEIETLLFDKDGVIEYRIGENDRRYFMDCEYCDICVRVEELAVLYPDLSFELSCIDFDGCFAFADVFQGGKRTYDLTADVWDASWYNPEDDYPIRENGVFDAILSTNADNNHFDYVYREYQDSEIVLALDGTVSGVCPWEYHFPWAN